MTSRWQRLILKLIALAEDQAGKPEGQVAREKIAQILKAHPEATQYEGVTSFIKRDLTMADIRSMERSGISREGSWTGRNLHDAIKLMEEEYKRRIAAYWVAKEAQAQLERDFEIGLDGMWKTWVPSVSLLAKEEDNG